MSANSTNPSAAPSASVNANAIIHPSLSSIMIGHTFLTLLLPLLIALFYFSTPQSRRRPIFILNVVAIILGFTACAMIDALAIHSILSLQDPWPPSVNIAIGIIGAFQSMFIDVILFVRLVSVYPLSHLGPRRFVILITLPMLLKIARLTNMIIFIKVLADASRGSLGPERIAITWATTPYLKIEWSAQMADNAYATLAFLWAIRNRGNRQGVTSNIYPSRVTFAQRMRTLSRIALSNFVFPTLFSIAQLVVVYRNVEVLVVNDIVLANVMVAVFGVVFATVWANKVHRNDTESEQWGDADDGANESGDPEKKQRPPANGHRAFAFPGLGSWRVASSSPPPTVTFGSSVQGYAGVPTASTVRGAAEGTSPGGEHDRGVALVAGSGIGSLGTVAAADSLDELKTDLKDDMVAQSSRY